MTRRNTIPFPILFLETFGAANYHPARINPYKAAITVKSTGLTFVFPQTKHPVIQSIYFFLGINDLGLRDKAFK